MKNKTLTDRIKAAALAIGLSVLPAKEVNSAEISYGGSIGIDLNRNISVGGYITSTDKANSLFGKMGLNYVLLGRDKGHLSLRIGGGYSLENGMTPSIEGSYTPKSANPFSIGAGLGYSLVKKDEKEGDINGAVGEEPLECDGGTITEEGDCKCPEGTVFSSGPLGRGCLKVL